MANGFNPAQSFQTARSNALGIQAQEQSAALQPQRNALADLKLTQAKTQGQRATTEFDQSQGLIKGKFLLNAVSALKGLPVEVRNQAAQRLAPQAQQIGIDINSLDLTQPLTDEVLDRMGSEAQTIIGSLSSPLATSAAEREFTSLSKGLSPEDRTKAERIKLGLDARATGSAALTTAQTPGATEAVASSEAIIKGAVEQAKLKKKLTFQPQIASAVKLAEAAAKERGEVLTDLARSEAAMPGLLAAVGQLKELAPIATSTLGGKAFDFAVKESGFGATKGANARAKFIAIVNNQVLPLLKATFGAAFTFQEGESLKATMGDPDASPTQKIEQLNAFIDQKVRDIGTRKLQLGGDLTNVSDDDLLSF